jgi:hypothetical protein
MRSRCGREGTEEVGAAQQLEDGRSDAVGGLDLLEFELVAPGDERTPDKLIGGDDDEDDDGDAAEQGAHVAGIGGGLEVAAEAGQLEVAGRPW